jgi:acyl-CoA synthetase (AMP-forming)/AMP-acid ligase II
MVKRRGFRIELGEIERALYRDSRVTQAAVISVPDADAGVRIVAFLGCPAGRPTIIELKTFCAKHLPAYMSPDRFVVQHDLPRTTTDKVDYQALKRSLAEAAEAASLPPAAEAEARR